MNSKSLPLFRGELALCIAVLMNSFGVVLMLYSGAGISAISSVPFAFSDLWPVLTLGTLTYLFQGCLVLSLMLLRKKFVPSSRGNRSVGTMGSLQRLESAMPRLIRQ